jgi:hypothetical protein
MIIGILVLISSIGGGGGGGSDNVGNLWNRFTGNDRRDGDRDRRDRDDRGRDRRDRDGRDDRGNPRPPGPEPPLTPPSRNPRDPPMPRDRPKFGVDPKEPPIPIPKEPKKPKIPDDKVIRPIDLSIDFFNPIRSQADMGACTAFAATSMFEYFFNVLGVHDLAKRYLSPLFLYYHSRKRQGKEHLDEGTGGRLAVDTLQKMGVCMEDLWTFELARTGKFAKPPSREAEMDALLKKIEYYSELDPTDPDQWVHAIDDDHNPCYICSFVPKDWDYYFKKKGLYTNYKPELSIDDKGNYERHAMVLVGYHSHYPHEGKGIKAFKIRNSWDVNWGENGYIWVPAEILKEDLIYFVSIFKGWKKDDKGFLKEKESEHDLKETEEILERIKEYAEGEKKLLGGEFEHLRSLQKVVKREKYQRASRLMDSVGRSEFEVDGFEKEIEKNISDLMHNIPEPYISVIRNIEVELKALAGTLVKLSSRHRGSIRLKLNEIIKGLKSGDIYNLNKNALNNMIDEAITTVNGLIVELDKLLNLEEDIHKNTDQRLNH